MLIFKKETMFFQLCIILLLAPLFVKNLWILKGAVMVFTCQGLLSPISGNQSKIVLNAQYQSSLCSKLSIVFCRFSGLNSIVSVFL